MPEQRSLLTGDSPATANGGDTSIMVVPPNIPDCCRSKNPGTSGGGAAGHAASDDDESKLIVMQSYRYGYLSTRI